MFDPTDHTVAEVREYLKAHPEDAEAVVAAERDRTDGEVRSSILAMAPESDDRPLPPKAGDAAPTAGSEQTGPTADPVQAELDGYSDRVGALSDDQRRRLESLLDDGTDWDRMQTDADVRSRFGAALSQAERPFTAPQDESRGDEAVPYGSAPGEGQALNEDGETVSVADVRGDAVAQTVAPARGE